MASSLFRRYHSRIWSTLPPPATSPWLMLPPAFKGGDMLYNFYSLEDDKVFTFNKRRRGAGGGVIDSDQIPPDDAKSVGSSHGWLASFDEKSNRVFLSNPISGRHIKLPAIDTLPDPHINLFEGRGSISRVILSSSPEEEEACHAVTTFGPGGRLAFCTVGVSSDWTALGDKYVGGYDLEHDAVRFARRPWEDFVYCPKRRVFSTIQPLSFDHDCYFLRDKYGRHEKHCEMYHWKIPQGYVGQSFISALDVAPLIGYYRMTDQLQMPHLVCAEQISDLPLIVMRGLDESYDREYERMEVIRAHINSTPYQSEKFLVLEIDGDPASACRWRDVEDLKGLAIFVGMNHSFAIPATGKLKPNSIYFTDAARITPPDPDAPKIYGGHDIGIFDYEKETISPCYYPCDRKSFKRIDPPPMWFTPSFD